MELKIVVHTRRKGPTPSLVECHSVEVEGVYAMDFVFIAGPDFPKPGPGRSYSCGGWDLDVGITLKPRKRNAQRFIGILTAPELANQKRKR